MGWCYYTVELWILMRTLITWVFAGCWIITCIDFSGCKTIGITHNWIVTITRSVYSFSCWNWVIIDAFVWDGNIWVWCFAFCNFNWITGTDIFCSCNSRWMGEKNWWMLIFLRCHMLSLQLCFLLTFQWSNVWCEEFGFFACRFVSANHFKMLFKHFGGFWFWRYAARRWGKQKMIIRIRTHIICSWKSFQCGENAWALHHNSRHNRASVYVGDMETRASSALCTAFHRSTVSSSPTIRIRNKYVHSVNSKVIIILIIYTIFRRTPNGRWCNKRKGKKLNLN